MFQVSSLSVYHLVTFAMPFMFPKPRLRNYNIGQTLVCRCDSLYLLQARLLEIKSPTGCQKWTCAQAKPRQNEKAEQKLRWCRTIPKSHCVRPHAPSPAHFSWSAVLKMNDVWQHEGFLMIRASCGHVLTDQRDFFAAAASVVFLLRRPSIAMEAP